MYFQNSSHHHSSKITSLETLLSWLVTRIWIWIEQVFEPLPVQAGSWDLTRYFFGSNQMQAFGMFGARFRTSVYQVQQLNRTNQTLSPPEHMCVARSLAKSLFDREPLLVCQVFFNFWCLACPSSESKLRKYRLNSIWRSDWWWWFVCASRLVEIFFSCMQNYLNRECESKYLMRRNHRFALSTQASSQWLGLLIHNRLRDTPLVVMANVCWFDAVKSICLNLKMRNELELLVNPSGHADHRTVLAMRFQ